MCLVQVDNGEVNSLLKVNNSKLFYYENIDLCKKVTLRKESWTGFTFVSALCSQLRLLPWS